MDRKSFFKRVLFAIGAAVVPGAILKATQKEGPVIGQPAIPFDNSTTLYWQMMALMDESKNSLVKCNKFYWSEYDSDEGLKVFQGPQIDPTPVTFTLRKTENV